ncbi:MAG: 4-oxalocrotonate decarboxylase [Candidatus Carbobacillus altaicus]|uniref:4-oxalocrotonate decarboxylase n=1 Tax=Candidatus Carbonibacillus altaicus TaxID=2163959 RepID=A0A2R6XXI8_9BACL|nr:MAG: 4-oxalocrotonate decarboxylase [Candidatus Carbobacillus altaicus]
MSTLHTLADRLRQAEKEKTAIPPLTADLPDLSIDEAYKIQMINTEKRLASGDEVVGKKIGLTSRAMQQLLGVDQPDYGYLFASMHHPLGKKLVWERLFQPKVEGEIAFIMRERLKGPGVTEDDVRHATQAVVPAIEIVDSRIQDWQIKLADTIADNASSGLFILGEKVRALDIMDLAEVKMRLYKNGEFVNEGKGSDVLGHPLKSVAWLANFLGRYGVALEKDEIVLSGAISAAVSCVPGDIIQIEFLDWESLSLQC